MRLISTLLLCSSLLSAERIWSDARVDQIEYSNGNPIGPNNKAVKYTLTMADGSVVSAYHISPSAFSGFRKELAESGQTAKVSVRKSNLYWMDKAGKTHRLHIHTSNKRPPKGKKPN